MTYVLYADALPGFVRFFGIRTLFIVRWKVANRTSPHFNAGEDNFPNFRTPFFAKFVFYRYLPDENPLGTASRVSLLYRTDALLLDSGFLVNGYVLGKSGRGKSCTVFCGQYNGYIVFLCLQYFSTNNDDFPIFY